MTNKIFLISDTHFGYRSNNLEYLGIIKDYFNEYFIPMLKEKVQPGDILVHCGDLFDSRQSINVLVLNTALEIFEEISKILPVHILAGNHDTYNKSSNDINSIKIFGLINSITVYTEPKLITLKNEQKSKKVLFMPWRNTKESEIETLEKYSQAEIVFCHTDVNNLKYNNLQVVDNANDITIFNQFKRVFSGHIHHRQELKNLTIVGCPYALNRADVNNIKGTYIYDPFTNELEFIENKFSPRFVKYDVEYVMGITLEKFTKLIKNNFVDVIASSKFSIDFPFTKLVELVSGYRKINFISVTDNDELLFENNTENDLSNFNFIKLSEIYINSLNYSDKIKSLALKKINELYNRVIIGDDSNETA